MRFQLLDIVPYVEHPVTGRLVSPAERLDQAVELARRAERLGFDAFSVGERHAGRFLSSSPSTPPRAAAASAPCSPPTRSSSPGFAASSGSS